MAYPIEKKLVVAVASSALFDLTESDKVFRTQGLQAYKEYQRQHENEPLEKGVAFPFVKRLLRLNTVFPASTPIEVILMSRNSPETGLRVFNSIKHYQLDITRAGFTSGQSNFQYLPALNTSLFLSANEEDVNNAIEHGYAAGRVLNKTVIDNDDDMELRIAFDFDGVIAGDDAEQVYQKQGIASYMESEAANANVPLNTGPIIDLLKKISTYQQLERKIAEKDSTYKKVIKII